MKLASSTNRPVKMVHCGLKSRSEGERKKGFNSWYRNLIILMEQFTLIGDQNVPQLTVSNGICKTSDIFSYGESVTYML